MKTINILMLGIMMPAAVAQAGFFDLENDSVSNTTVGYGHSGVNKVTQEKVVNGQANTAVEALNGKVAGVQVSNQDAMVSAVRVRGTTSLTGGNDPLVIIDGVSSDINTLSFLYPADIESITVLKDAAETAQYGSRGAAGVIQIVTKKGKARKFQISYDGNIGFESVYDRPDMLNADEYRQVMKALGHENYTDGGTSSNALKAIEKTGFVQNHHISFGGGDEQANYRASLGVMDHQTVIRTNRLRNYVAKLDITQKAFDNFLTIDLGFFGSIQKNNYLPNAQKLYYSAATFNPTMSVERNANGSYNSVNEAYWTSNPMALLDMKQDEDNAHFNSHIKLSAKLAPRLSLSVFGSYSYTNVNNAHYYPTYVWNKGEAYHGDDKTTDFFGNILLNYHYKKGISDLNLTGLIEGESVKTDGFFVTTTNMATDVYGYHNMMAGAERPWEGTDSYYTKWNMMSGMVRGQYTLMERYTVSGSVRADGSSKLSKDHRWGYFPSISGTWVVSNEPWMKNVKFINKAQVRIGYGLAGNLGGIDSYNSVEMVEPNGVVSVNNTPTVTLGILSNANKELKWEVKKTFNMGFDVKLWNGRISLSLDHYHSKTKDMLYPYDVPVPPFTYSVLVANLGRMESHGTEIGFGITPVSNRDLTLSVSMNWSFQSNKLQSLNGFYGDHYLTTPENKGISALYGAGFNGSSDVVKQIVGHPLGVFELPHCNGLVTDENGHKKYDVTKEKYICGQATPKSTMGADISLRYRDWDLNVHANGAFGHKIFNGTALTYMNMLSLPAYNVMKEAPETGIYDQTISDYWLERGDYVNIDYVTLGWSVPVKSRYISLLRLSATVKNLVTFTGYSGVTPMINSSAVNSTLGIDDKNTMPAYRAFMLGASIKF